MTPIWQQNKLREFCKANNIIVTAYSPLGAKGTSWGTNQVWDNQVLNDIARARGKTVAQVHNSTISNIILLCSLRKITSMRGSNINHENEIFLLTWSI